MAVYRHFHSVRTALYALFTGVILWGALVPASSMAAGQDELFTVENVEVDMTADNAVQAREKALEEAQVKAYHMLAERFYTPEQMATFVDPDPLLVSAMVQDFEVTNEQLSKVRYKGIFTVRFRPTLVRQHLPVNDYGAVQAMQSVPPTLILPYYQVEKRTVLWDSSNVWLKSWAARPATDGTADPLIVPIGDLLDVSQMPDDKALTYDPQMLDQMKGRYSADQAAILIAIPKPNALDISIYDARRTGPAYIQTLQVVGQPGEDPAVLYQRAVQQAALIMRGNWKNQPRSAELQPSPGQEVVNPYGQPIQPQPVTGPAAVYNGRVMFSSVQEWVQLKKAMEHVPGVRSVIVKGLKPREAQVVVTYAGDAVTLATGLQRTGVTMRSPTGQQAGYFPGANGAPVYEFSSAAAPRY